METYIDEYLMERQARKENLTVAQLLEQHVNSAIAKDPDESALRVYYEGVDTNEPFEAVRPKILEALRQLRSARAKTAYLLTLHSQARISIRLPPPRVPVSRDRTAVRGPAGAPLTWVEFADYECSYCRQMQPVLNQLEDAYMGRLAFAYKDFPLPMHPHAQKTAEAARCAGFQNRYWEYHDALLKTPGLELPQLKARARDLGLDPHAFEECLDSGSQSGAVRTQEEEGQKLGVTGTPGFFLNGRFSSGLLVMTNYARSSKKDSKKRRFPVS